MDTKRLVLVLVLSVVVLVVWQWLFPPPPPPVREAGVADAPVEEAAAPPVPEPVPEPPAVDTERVEAEVAEDVVVENGLARVVLTNRGGRVASWRLTQYTDKDEEPLELVPAAATAADLLPLAVDVDDRALAERINGALFQVERNAVGPGQERIAFRWADGRGLEVVKTLTFGENRYPVRVSLEVTDRGRPVAAGIVVGPGFRAQETDSGLARFRYGGQAVGYRRGHVLRWPADKVDAEIRGGPWNGMLWAGLEEYYFAALLVPDAGAADVVVRPVEVSVPSEEDEEAERVTELQVALRTADGRADLLIVPKDFRLLKAQGADLQKVIWFSRFSLIDLLARYLFLALLWIFDHLVANYGLAIILVTLALRIVFFPLNQFSMVRMKKMQTEMQRIQPKIKAIQNKYRKKKDAESRGQMNQEMMALYKREGVNPMGGLSGGCLPLLVQFPILIAFYNVLSSAVELRGSPFFGWIQDLTAKDPFYVTPLLMGASMFLQQKMASTKMGDPTQQRIMMMTPAIFTVMFLNLPSGLVLYWFVNNLLGIGQQWLVNRHFGRVESAAKATKRA